MHGQQKKKNMCLLVALWHGLPQGKETSERQSFFVAQCSLSLAAFTT